MTRDARDVPLDDDYDPDIERGTDPAVVGDRDEPDLPVRTSLDQPEASGGRPRS